MAHDFGQQWSVPTPPPRVVGGGLYLSRQALEATMDLFMVKMISFRVYCVACLLGHPPKINGHESATAFEITRIQKKSSVSNFDFEISSKTLSLNPLGINRRDWCTEPLEWVYPNKARYSASSKFS
ncbi:hypothetical protein M569_06108 [Genlisea aurea]|uniref:Uncharacterized protein n=1 Tax=Genlisea aurea TaxID=192259 RepID=S8CPI5_9LAMI|nr:hypothetical protein M569_06108 [Genlisea aurea]